MDVLLVLAMHHGDVVSNDALVNAAWAGRAVTDDVFIRCDRHYSPVGFYRAYWIRTIAAVHVNSRLCHRFIAHLFQLAPSGFVVQALHAGCFSWPGFFSWFAHH